MKGAQSLNVRHILVSFIFIFIFLLLLLFPPSLLPSFFVSLSLTLSRFLCFCGEVSCWLAGRSVGRSVVAGHSWDGMGWDRMV